MLSQKTSNLCEMCKRQSWWNLGAYWRK